MKKKFTFLIAALALLSFLAIPMGMRGESPYSLTPDQTSTGSSSTSYITTLTEFTYNSVSWKMNQWNPSSLQIKTNQSSPEAEFRYYNTSAFPGRITQVVMTFSALTLSNTSNTGFMFVGGTSEVTATSGGTSGTWNETDKTITWTPGTSDDFTYFAFYQNGKVATQTNKLATSNAIVVTYETSGSTTTTYTVTYNANGGTGTMTDTNSPYEENDVVTLLTNTFYAPEGQMWNSWLVKDASDNTITPDNNNQFTMPASNVTVTAQWVDDPNAPQYEWVETALTDLGASDIFVIVGNNSYAMASTLVSNTQPAAVEVTVANGKISGTPADNLKWNVTGNSTDGFTFHPNGDATNYLYCNTTAASGSNTNMRIGTQNSNTRNLYVLSDNHLVTKDSHTARYVHLNGTTDWRGYVSASTNSTTVKFYKRQLVTNDPSISAANPEELTYNAPSGNISYTINNYVSNGAISANTEATWITNFTYTQGASGTVSFSTETNPSANQRSATVTLTYTYNTNQTVTKNVTVTQAGNPTIVDNISSITGENQSLAVKGSIVAISARGFVIGDNTGYVYYYKGSGFTTTHSIGNVVKLTGTTDSYNNVIQFPDGTAIEDATGSFSAPAITVVDANNIAPYSEGLHLSDYVQIQGTLTKSTSNNNTYYNIAIEGVTNTASISYPTAAQAAELDALENKAVIVKGYFAGVSSGHFNAIMASVEELLTPTISVTPATVNAPFAETDGTLTVTYTAIETGASIYWFTDETCATEINEPAWIAAEINSSLNVGYTIEANTGDARTAYMKVYGLDSDANAVYSNLVTFNQAKYVAEYATLPFSFDGGRDDIPNTSGLTQENIGTDYSSSPKLRFEKGNKDNDGLYSTLILRINERPGTLSFDIKNNSFSEGTFKVQTSEDGVTYTDLKVYTEITGTQSEEFNNLGENVRYIKWIYTEKVNGNVALGNIALAAFTADPSITVTPETANPTATTEEGTLDITYANITINNMTDFGVQFYDENNNELNDNAVPGWIEVLVAEQDPSVGEGYVVSYTMDVNEGTARTAYFKVFAMGANDFVYSNLVTITQAAPVVDYAILPFEWDTFDETPSGITNSGVSTGSNNTYLKFDNGGDYIILRINGAPGVLTFDVKGNPGQSGWAGEFKVQTSVDGDSYSDLATYDDLLTDDYQSESFTSIDASVRYIKWVYTTKSQGNVALDNIIVTKAMPITEPTTTWTAGEFMPAGNHTYIVGNGATLTLNGDFSASLIHASQIIVEDGGQLITNYPVKATVKKSVTHSNSKNAENWYTISSPVDNPDFADVDNLIQATVANYDLYRYNETTMRWENQKNTTDHPDFTTLVNGRGYLYWNSTGSELSFAGDLNVGDVTYSLTCAAQKESLTGFNLIGNPYSHNIYKGTGAAIDSDKLADGFYVLNNASGWSAKLGYTDAIIPGQGILVQATEAFTLTITNTNAAATAEKRANNDFIAFNVTNGQYDDVAYAKFSDAAGLMKIDHMNSDIPMLYIHQNDGNYAIANMDRDINGFDLNFVASTDGEYTISAKALGEFDYFHLIDRITGEDIDMLSKGNYTFNAKASDHEFRFFVKLSAYNANENGNDSFAFISNGQIILTNVDNDATVQVIDALGRMIVNTNANNHVYTDNMAPGVYVLRLVNGNDVKTQKIVVK